VNDVFEDMYISLWYACEESPEISVSRITPQVENNCMRQIPLGTKGTFTLHVQPEHLANRFKDARLPQVLAAPVMILIMENAALNAMRKFLDVRARGGRCTTFRRHACRSRRARDSRVVNVEGKRIDFRVSASDGRRNRQQNPPANRDRSSFNERLAKK
jgi:fluoroacetyl-CoA thioesterase